MKHLSVTAVILALILAFVVMPCSQAADKNEYVVGNLKPGPHAVGFKVVHEYDHTETWAPKYDENDNLIRQENPRPMQIALWYPAEGTGHSHPMAYKEYWYLDATRVDFKELSAEDKRQLDQAFINMGGFAGPARPGTREELMNVPTTAYMNAHAKEGRYPLVLYAPREYRGVYLNSVLCEYLASHGYIVVATPNKDRANHIQQSMPDADIVDAYVSDLKFVMSYMRNFPGVDINTVGGIGYSIGAASPLLLSLRHPNVQAIVSFQGILANPLAKTVLETIPYYSPKNLRAPIMHLTPAMDNQGNPAKFDLANEMLYADRYLVRIKGANNLGFSSFFNAAWMKPAVNSGQFDYEAIDRGYDTAVTYTLQFLNAYLKGDNHSMKFIAQSRMDNAEVEKSAALKAPPTENYFVKVFNEHGPEKAWSMYREVKKHDSDYKIFSANTINNLGYSHIGQGKFQEAVKAFELYTDAYPQDPNGFDSSGEGYLAAGMKEKAIASFKKSLSMNPPQNVRNNSLQLLRELGVSMEDTPTVHPLLKVAARKKNELYPQAPPFNHPSRVSPNRDVSGRIGDCEIKIEYGAPYVRGRRLVGGLISTYRVWRTGANEATVINLSDDVMVEGKKLQAGAYSLFTIGGENEWTVIFNKVPNQWGTFGYDATADALRVDVTPKKAAHQEEMKFEINKKSNDSGDIVLSWGDIAVPLQVKLSSH